MKEKTEIDNQEEKIDPLTTEKAEVYLEGLRIAAEMGSISCGMLQRKLSIIEKNTAHVTGETLINIAAARTVAADGGAVFVKSGTCGMTGKSLSAVIDRNTVAEYAVVSQSRRIKTVVP